MTSQPVKVKRSPWEALRTPSLQAEKPPIEDICLRVKIAQVTCFVAPIKRSVGGVSISRQLLYFIEYKEYKVYKEIRPPHEAFIYAASRKPLRTNHPLLPHKSPITSAHFTHYFRTKYPLLSAQIAYRITFPKAHEITGEAAHKKRTMPKVPRSLYTSRFAGFLMWTKVVQKWYKNRVF